MKSYRFKAKLEIIGVNPFVFVPEKILAKIFADAGKQSGYIPVCGAINSEPYRQTLVKYSGSWRLYINTSMLKNSPRRISEVIDVSIAVDADSREVMAPKKFIEVLSENSEAKSIYDGLPPSRRLEINRYLANLKTEESLNRNIKRAIAFLLGKERFIGRDKP